MNLSLLVLLFKSFALIAILLDIIAIKIETFLLCNVVFCAHSTGWNRYILRLSRFLSVEEHWEPSSPNDFSSIQCIFNLIDNAFEVKPSRGVLPCLCSFSIVLPVWSIYGCDRAPSWYHRYLLSADGSTTYSAACLRICSLFLQYLCKHFNCLLLPTLSEFFEAGDPLVSLFANLILQVLEACRYLPNLSDFKYLENKVANLLLAVVMLRLFNPNVCVHDTLEPVCIRHQVIKLVTKSGWFWLFGLLLCSRTSSPLYKMLFSWKALDVGFDVLRHKKVDSRSSVHNLVRFAEDSQQLGRKYLDFHSFLLEYLWAHPKYLSGEGAACGFNPPALLIHQNVVLLVVLAQHPNHLEVVEARNYLDEAIAAAQVCLLVQHKNVSDCVHVELWASLLPLPDPRIVVGHVQRRHEFIQGTPDNLLLRVAKQQFKLVGNPEHPPHIFLFNRNFKRCCLIIPTEFLWKFVVRLTGARRLEGYTLPHLLCKLSIEDDLGTVLVHADQQRSWFGVILHCLLIEPLNFGLSVGEVIRMFEQRGSIHNIFSHDLPKCFVYIHRLVNFLPELFVA